MREEQHQFLTLLGQPPARLTVDQLAMVLNCNPHDVPILVVILRVRTGHEVAGQNPPPNGVKYFATVEVVKQMKDAKWLHRMTAAISQHWHHRNLRQKENRKTPDSLPPVCHPQ